MTRFRWLQVIFCIRARFWIHNHLYELQKKAWKKCHFNPTSYMIMQDKDKGLLAELKQFHMMFGSLKSFSPQKKVVKNVQCHLWPHSTVTISRIPTQRHDLPGMRSSSTQISFNSNQPAQEKPESGRMGKAALSGICMNKRANLPHSELGNGFSVSARREVDAWHARSSPSPQAIQLPPMQIGRGFYF